MNSGCCNNGSSRRGRSDHVWRDRIDDDWRHVRGLRQTGGYLGQLGAQPEILEKRVEVLESIWRHAPAPEKAVLLVGFARCRAS
jgi:hypothetical protein